MRDPTRDISTVVRCAIALRQQAPVLIRLVLCLLIGGCGEGYVSVRGRVLDPNGGPVKNATVKLFVGSQTDAAASETTSDKGEFWVSKVYPAPMLRKVEIHLTVEKESFRKYSSAIEGSDKIRSSQIIKLQPLDETKSNKATVPKKGATKDEKTTRATSSGC